MREGGGLYRGGCGVGFMHLSRSFVVLFPLLYCLSINHRHKYNSEREGLIT